VKTERTEPSFPMTADSAMSYPSYVNPQVLTMFNVSTLLNQKDSRWLQLEVCREFQRQKCTRSDAECKFAHPPPNVEVQNGRVTACYDSIKGRCNREKPACKYFHPPQHLKDQLLINGRNHLALKNALAQQMQQQIIPGQMPAATMYGSPYASVPLTYSPYLPGLVSPGLLQGSDQTAVLQQSPPPLQHQPPQQIQQQPAKQRNDRIEACREWLRGSCARPDCRYAHPPDCVSTDAGTVRLCMDSVRGRCLRSPCRYYHAPPASATTSPASDSSPVGSTPQ